MKLQYVAPLRKNYQTILSNSRLSSYSQSPQLIYYHSPDQRLRQDRLRRERHPDIAHGVCRSLSHPAAFRCAFVLSAFSAVGSEPTHDRVSSDFANVATSCACGTCLQCARTCRRPTRHDECAVYSDRCLDDHAALTAALERSSSVIPASCFDHRHFGRTHHGFDETVKYRARFLLYSVLKLPEALSANGSNLVVRLGKP